MDIWNTNGLILFLTFVIPGFISIKTYDLIYPCETTDSSKKIVDAITYSCINYAFLSGLIYYLLMYEYRLWILLPSIIFILLIFPVLLVLIFSSIRKTEWIQNKLPHPTGLPWDFVFSKREEYWMVITLCDGNVFGGRFSSESFISSTPYPKQIYLEESWKLNDDNMFDRPHIRTKGLLIVTSDISHIELFSID